MLQKLCLFDKSVFKMFLTIIGMICITAMFLCSLLFIKGYSLQDVAGKQVAKEDLGLELVKAMYDFESPYELDAQMAIVRKITTDEVFNDVTIDNEQRTLLTYLKFKDCGSSVEVIESSDSFVHYRLVSDVIEPDREFILFFKIDKDGLICEIEEAECVKFLDTIY